VARGIGRVVCLDLDDRAADAVDEQRRADQVRGDLVDAPVEEVAAELALASAPFPRNSLRARGD
jgi:hypothetical protein